MKLYIPEIGSEIRLTANWTFDLYNEDRNSTMMEFMGDPRKIAWSKFDAIPTTILAGEILKVDRIYIRKGLEEYSSLTFYWKGKRTNSKMVEKWSTAYLGTHHVDKIDLVKQPARAVRFWAKLADVNEIICEPV
jgi:hypothetical protein